MTVRLMLKENTSANIRYQKGKELTKDRRIIVTFVPTPKYQNVKAIDVSSLTDNEADRLLHQWNEYQEYLINQRKILFGFEDFVEHTGGTLPKIQWRTFKPSQLEVVE